MGKMGDRGPGSRGEARWSPGSGGDLTAHRRLSTVPGETTPRASEEEAGIQGACVSSSDGKLHSEGSKLGWRVNNEGAGRAFLQKQTLHL